MISVLFLCVCVAWADDQCAAYQPYRRLVTISGPGAVAECEVMAERLAPEIPQELVGQVFLGCESYSAEQNEAPPARPAAPTHTSWL